MFLLIEFNDRSATVIKGTFRKEFKVSIGESGALTIDLIRAQIGVFCKIQKILRVPICFDLLYESAPISGTFLRILAQSERSRNWGYSRSH